MQKNKQMYIHGCIIFAGDNMFKIKRIAICCGTENMINWKIREGGMEQK